MDIMIGLIICIFIGAMFFLIKNKFKEQEQKILALMQEAKENNIDKDLLLKQQETLTSVSNIQNNYKIVLEQLQEMNKTNSSSTQVISDISTRISSMNDIMVNKKSRGNWGEYQLNTLISVYAGESQEIFETQYSLKNGFIGDVALHLPGNDKVLIIDSKFPLENYLNITKEGITDLELQRYVSMFKQNIKKHINDISRKYITEETTEQAVMFVPSEAIYTYICSEHSDLIEYAHRNHILLTSPTTLLGVVFTLVNATKDFNRSKNVKEIEKTIVIMADDAKRLSERVEKSQGYLTSLNKSLNDVKISSDKITNKISKISDGYIEDESDKKKGE